LRSILRLHWQRRDVIAANSSVVFSAIGTPGARAGRPIARLVATHAARCDAAGIAFLLDL
jgi:hypothetical protein